MRNKSLGFEQEQIVVIPFAWDELVQDRYELLKTQLLQHTSVRDVTASGDVPGRMFTTMGYWIEGMDETESGGINALVVDPDFAETYGLEMVAGDDSSMDQAAALGETRVSPGLGEARSKQHPAFLLFGGARQHFEPIELRFAAERPNLAFPAHAIRAELRPARIGCVEHVLDVL